jgi:SAM-dependent methyltransferase
MKKPVDRFSNRVENYTKYRPHYPEAVLNFLEDFGVLGPDSVVADIGSGTGISARLFLENGNRVIGVEPNGPMRTESERYLSEYPNFTAVSGTSDATTLLSASVDLTVAAQAFHWFEPDSARAEFKRITKPGGAICLIWNERQLGTTPFLRDFEQFLLNHADDYRSVRHENVDEAALARFFGSEYTTAVFPNEQVFDFEGLRGRVLSSSYMPDAGSERYAAMNEDLESLFAKHAENGKIKVLYDTRVHVSRV